MAFTGGAQAKLSELESRLAFLEAFVAGAPFNKTHVVTGVPAPGLGNDGDLAADIGDPLTSTGLVYHKVAGVWVNTTFQAWTE